jgi:hypothetical protein
VDIAYVAQLLGHESLETTQRYLKIEIGDLKRMHSLYHPREQDRRGSHVDEEKHTWTVLQTVVLLKRALQ